MKKYLTELIGTFFLVLTIGNAVASGSALAPLAIGATLMVMIFAGGHVSGAHYNPAVTLAVTIRGRCSVADAIPYILAQLLGAVMAALAVASIQPLSAYLPSKELDLWTKIPQAMLAESLYTFALAYVVLNVATSKDTANNSFYGLAIGFTVLAGAVSVGGISGGAFNPAVAVGISVLGLTKWSNLWIYVVAEMVGATVAAIAFKVINPEDK